MIGRQVERILRDTFHVESISSSCQGRGGKAYWEEEDRRMALAGVFVWVNFEIGR